MGGTRNFQSFFICFFFLYFLNWKFVGYFYGIRADTFTPFILFFSPLKIYIFNLNKLSEIHHTIFDLFYFATTTRKYRNFNAIFVYDINQQKKKKNEQINEIDCNFSIEQFIDIDDALASATLKLWYALFWLISSITEAEA